MKRLTSILVCAAASSCIASPSGSTFSDTDGDGETADMAAPADEGRIADADGIDDVRSADLGGDVRSVDVGPESDLSGGDAGRPNRLVRQVDQVKFTIPDGTSTESFALPRVIDSDNTIPFISLRTSGVNVEDTAVHMEVADDAVSLNRKGSVGEVTLIASLVEFNPTKVRVQRGAFVGLDSFMLDDPVVPENTFVVHSYAVEVADDARNEAFIATELGAESVSFYSAGEGPFGGTVWVAESLTGDFTVRHVTGEMVSGTATAQIDVQPRVDPSRSFLIYSTSVEEPNMKPSKGHVACTLTSGEVVDCVREDGDRAVHRISVQVVELADGAVRRGVNMMTEGAVVQGSALAPGVSLTRTTAWCGVTGAHGAYRSNEEDDGQAVSGYATCELLASGEAIQTRRADGAQDAMTAPWNVIEWP